MYKPIARTFVERISCLYKSLELSTPCAIAVLQTSCPDAQSSHKAKLNNVFCELAGVCFPAAFSDRLHASPQDNAAFNYPVVHLEIKRRVCVHTSQVDISGGLESRIRSVGHVSEC
jgi:hypothetical protein